jgi:hypothetical protein
VLRALDVTGSEQGFAPPGNGGPCPVCCQKSRDVWLVLCTYLGTRRKFGSIDDVACGADLNTTNIANADWAPCGVGP